MSSARFEFDASQLLGGRYRISREIARGGMGIVYAAEHVLIGRRVAIKVLNETYRDDQEVLQRFRREAWAAGVVDSPYVVASLDYGFSEEGLPFIVMERPEGADLRRLLQGRMPLTRACSLTIDACRGLEVVHAGRIVHRDLKPSNLFVAQTNDGAEICKILDFGIAQVRVAGKDGPLTGTGTPIGTLRYMSPEQVEGTRQVDHRTDIYSLAAILYECVTGEPPHRGETDTALLHDIVHGTPRVPSEVVDDLPRRFDQVMQKALSKDPDARYQSAIDFGDALAEFSRGRTASLRKVHRYDLALPKNDESTLTAFNSLPRRLPVGKWSLTFGTATVGLAMGYLTGSFAAMTEVGGTRGAVSSDPVAAEIETPPERVSPSADMEGTPREFDHASEAARAPGQPVIELDRSSEAERSTDDEALTRKDTATEPGSPTRPSATIVGTEVESLSIFDVQNPYEPPP